MDDLRKADEENWTEKLIRAVESKRPLYDSSMKDYSNRELIRKLWREVCETVYDNWNDLTLKEKAIKRNEVQSRWRNLRTCFKREINKQRNAQSPNAEKNRRRYVYFNKLLFLLPIIGDKYSRNSFIPNQDNEKNDEEEYEVEHLDVADDDYMEQQTEETTNDANFSRNDGMMNQNSLPNMLACINETAIDEDVLFLLSLVPSFKKFSEDQKCDAKMEFLKVIKRILAQRSNSNVRRVDSKNSHLLGDGSSNNFEQILSDCPNLGNASVTYVIGGTSAYSSDASQPN